MKIGVLGAATVAQTIGTRLIELGHDVTLGSRTPNNPRSAEWVAKAGAGAHAGTLADAAAAGTMVFNCTLGSASLEAVERAGARNLAGKILVDVTNALDASAGMPPRLLRCNDSLGEQIQRALPDTKVVKTFNTMWCGLMVRPRLIPESHQNFICGDDAKAKAQVCALLTSFGWRPDEIMDLGDITAARAVEAWLPLCSMIAGVVKGPFNIKILPVPGN